MTLEFEYTCVLRRRSSEDGVADDEKGRDQKEDIIVDGENEQNVKDRARKLQFEALELIEWCIRFAFPRGLRTRQNPFNVLADFDISVKAEESARLEVAGFCRANVFNELEKPLLRLLQ